MRGTCVACGFTGVVDRAHIRTRGAGAGWGEDEYMPLCRGCHTVQGRMGWRGFCARHPSVEEELRKRGWRIVQQFGRSRLERGTGEEDV